MLAAVEDALLTLLRTYAGIDAANSALDDWGVALDCQGSYGLCVEQSGDTVEADEIDGYGHHRNRTQAHDLSVSVAYKIGQGQGGDGVATQACKGLAEALADHIAAYERLGGAAYVQRARVLRISAPSEVRPRMQGGQTGSPTHVVVAIRVRVITSKSWTPVETSH